MSSSSPTIPFFPVGPPSFPNELWLAWMQHFISGIHPAVWPPLAWNCEKDRDHNHLKIKSSATVERKTVRYRENVCVCVFCAAAGLGGPHRWTLIPHASFAFAKRTLDLKTHIPLSSSTYTNTFPGLFPSLSACLYFSSSFFFLSFSLG